MKSGMRKGIAVLFIWGVSWLAAGSAQTNGGPLNRDLEFRIVPGAVVRGMPQAFHFLLVNRTDHEVRLPVPSFKCSDGFSGSILLNLRFTPKVAGRFPMASGCAGDTLNWPEIAERVREWQVLPPGFALAMDVDPKHIAWKVGLLTNIAAQNIGEERPVQFGLGSYWYDDNGPGTYEFWATYNFPSIRASDQTKLREMGLDFPHAAGALSQSTEHVTFIKDR